MGVGEGVGVGLGVAASGTTTKPAGSVPPTRLTEEPALPVARSTAATSLVPLTLVPST